MKSSLDQKKSSFPCNRILRYEQLEERLTLSVSPLFSSNNLERIPDVFENDPIFSLESQQKNNAETQKAWESTQAEQAQEDWDVWNKTNLANQNNSISVRDSSHPSELISDEQLYSNPINDYFHRSKPFWTDDDFLNRPDEIYTTLDFFPFPSRNWSYAPDSIGENGPLPSNDLPETTTQIDSEGSAFLYPSYNTSVASNYENYTHLNYVRSQYGLTGKDQTVVVIDTGIYSDHIAFSNGRGGNRVIAWQDFVNAGNNTPIDTGYHGTHVSGIIASSDPNNLGIAPNVNLVVLQVFDSQGYVSQNKLKAALQWVIDHKSDDLFLSRPISTINMSLGFNTVSYFADTELSQLRNMGVFISCAAGNNFADTVYMAGNPAKIEYPGSSGYAIPVSAFTDVNGMIDLYSQRKSSVIVAPGSSIRSSVPNNVGGSGPLGQQYGCFSGTSMAAPYVAGSAVLLYEAIATMEGVAAVSGTNLPGLQNRIYNMMFASNNCDRIYDSATSQYYSRLNLQKVLDNYTNGIDNLDPGNSSSQFQTFSSLGQTPVRLSGYISSAIDRDYCTFTATMNGYVKVALQGTPIDGTGTNENLTTSWDKLTLAGATIGSDGCLYIPVVAGTTYKFGVVAASGLGKYTLETSYISYGTIPMPNALSGSTSETCSFYVTKTGRFTIEAMVEGQGTNTPIIISSNSGTPITYAEPMGTQTAGRLDINVSAGTILTITVKRPVGSIGSLGYSLRIANMITMYQGDQGSNLTTSNNPKTVEYYATGIKQPGFSFLSVKERSGTPDGSFANISVGAGTPYLFSTSSLYAVYCYAAPEVISRMAADFGELPGIIEYKNTIAYGDKTAFMFYQSAFRKVFVSINQVNTMYMTGGHFDCLITDKKNKFRVEENAMDSNTAWVTYDNQSVDRKKWERLSFYHGGYGASFGVDGNPNMGSMLVTSGDSQGDSAVVMLGGDYNYFQTGIARDVNLLGSSFSWNVPAYFYGISNLRLAQSKLIVNTGNGSNADNLYFWDNKTLKVELAKFTQSYNIIRDNYFPISVFGVYSGVTNIYYQTPQISRNGYNLYNATPSYIIANFGNSTLFNFYSFIPSTIVKPSYVSSSVGGGSVLSLPQQWMVERLLSEDESIDSFDLPLSDDESFVWTNSALTSPLKYSENHDRFSRFWQEEGYLLNDLMEPMG